MSSAMGKSSSAGTTAAQLLSSAPSAAEKNKQWQRELLMERIRSRANQHKSFAELSKAMRMSMLEKRYALDAVEKANLQKCLDSMQHCIKVTSRQGLVERLESLSRQLGLKFMEDTSGLFISTDMFFLEIILDANGALTDVKVHHECKIEQQSCSELVNCLNRGDFADFTVQLEGLSSIYQLNAEPKVKTKAFVALQAMETDLYNIFQMQNFTKDSQQLVKSSSVGLVLKRRGGHPMKLIYFVSPYDLISVETKSLQPLTTELITSKDVGFSVTVNLEASSANKLQILPIVSVTKDPQTGIDVPIYAPLNQQNSMLLPATFVLRLNKPLPVCHATLRALGIPMGSSSDGASGLESPHKKELVISPIMNLVVQTASDQQLKNSQKGLFVNLPDQTHCYFFTENRQMQATLVSSIPFTEPMQVPKILDFLKRQALFYTLLASCVRSQSKMGNDMESTTILEVNAISFQQISVSLQHPYEESMATVEFDLRDNNVKCTIYSISQNYDSLSMKLTKIVEKCLSIPVTIRALLTYWDEETMKIFQRTLSAGVSGGSGGGGGGLGGGLGNTRPSTSAAAYGNFNMALGSNDSGGGGAAGGVSGVGGGGSTGIKMEPNTRQQQQMSSMASTTNVLNAGAGCSTTTPNTNIAGFLQYKNEQQQQEDFHDSPKSQMQNSLASLHAVDSSSLGGIHHLQQQSQQQQQQHQQHQQHQQQQLPHEQQVAGGKQTDIEIADKYKNIWMDKTTNLKNCVSITPISPDGNSRGATQQGVDVKRAAGGIEIIPLNAQGGAANGGGGASSAAPSIISNPSSNPAVSQSGVNTTSSTITITPINASNTAVVKDKKLSSSTIVGSSSGLTPNAASTNISTVSGNSKRSLEAPSPTDTQKEKKRKKKRDDSPMGPPEKVYSRQNSPAATSEAAATVVARKFSSPSSSPKGGGGGGSSGGGILNSNSSAASLAAAGNAAAAAALLSTRPSPKHSPVYSSPKHSNTASNSPKSPFGTHSPKHGSSGKPSMSTLKNATAATSLSPKGDKSSCVSGSGLTGSNTVGLSAAAAAGVAAANAVKTAMGVGVGAGLGVIGMQQQMKSMNHLAASTQQMATAAGNAYGAGGVPNMGGMSGSGVGFGSGPLMSGNGAAGSGMDMNAATNAAASQAAAAMRKVVGGAVSSTASTMPVAQTTATVAQMQPETQIMQHSPPPPPPSVIGSNSETKVDEHTEQTTIQQQSTTINTTTSSEYMVKSSQEGLKLTINKTGGGGSGSGKSIGSHSGSSVAVVDSSSSSSSSSSSGSSTSSSTTTTTTATAKISKSISATSSNTTVTKKQHTGLKPGVNSGPASKKLASAKSKNTITTNAKHPFQKSNSSSSLSTKSSSSSASTSITNATSSNSHGLTKSHSANSFGDLLGSSASSSSRKSSKKSASSCNISTTTTTATTQPATRLDHQADMLKILQYASPAMAANMEGFIKGLNNSKFQIPKLSQRAVTTTTPTTTTPSSSTEATEAVAAATTTTSLNGAQITTSATSTQAPTSELRVVQQVNEASQQKQHTQKSYLKSIGSNMPSNDYQQGGSTGNAMRGTVNYYSQNQQQQMGGIQMQQTTPQYTNYHQQQHHHQQYHHYQQQQSALTSFGYHHQVNPNPQNQVMDESSTFRSSSGAAATTTSEAPTTTSAGLAGK